MIDVLQRKVEAHESEQGSQEETLDPRVLSSVLVNVKLAQTSHEEASPQDPHTKLLELTHSSPISALLDAAAVFAKRQSIAPHEALQQIIMNLQEIDKLWNQVLLKEGLARLSSQYH